MHDVRKNILTANIVTDESIFPLGQKENVLHWREQFS